MFDVFILEGHTETNIIEYMKLVLHGDYERKKWMIRSMQQHRRYIFSCRQSPCEVVRARIALFASQCHPCPLPTRRASQPSPLLKAASSKHAPASKRSASSYIRGPQLKRKIIRFYCASPFVTFIMSSESFSRGSQPPLPPGQPLQQQPFQVNTMDLGMGGYPSAAVAAAAVMGVEAYPSVGSVFGRLDYPPQVAVNRRTQKRQRQQQSNEDGGDGDVSAASQDPMEPAAENQKQQQNLGQFGILAPTPIPVSQQQNVAQAGMGVSGKTGSKIVVDPPDLDAWREKLFNVDEMIVLTQEQ